jgi:hypothetical protein
MVERAVAGAKALDSNVSSRLNGGRGSVEPFSGAFATMMTASSGKNPSGVHFPVQKRSFGAANLPQPILLGWACKGAAGAFGAPGISSMVRRVKEPFEDLAWRRIGDWRSGPTS